jgi:branched-chain amino acid transport system permease protein
MALTQRAKNPADFLRITLRSEWLNLIVLAFLIIFPHLVGWITGDSPFGVGGRPRGQSLFWQAIMIEVFVFAILAMSYNLMFGFSGVISFGHALFFGLGGYAMGMVLQYTELGPDLGLLVGVLVGLAIAGVVGFVMGLVSLRLKGVYFAIFTLALAEMAFIYVSRWSVTNAEDGFALSDLPDLFNPTRNRLFFYYFAMLAAIAVYLIIRRLMNSPTGRVLLAIRENEDRAQAIGFNTLTYKLLSITLASMMAAGAGMLLVILNKKVGPEIMSVGFTIDPLLMVIIGGIGTHAGPVLGAAGLHLSERILNREFEIGEITLNIGEYWSMVLGVAFIIVVLVFPQGIVGTFRTWQAKRRGTIKRQRSAEASPATGD